MSAYMKSSFTTVSWQIMIGLADCFSMEGSLKLSIAPFNGDYEFPSSPRNQQDINSSSIEIDRVSIIEVASTFCFWGFSYNYNFPPIINYERKIIHSTRRFSLRLLANPPGRMSGLDDCEFENILSPNYFKVAVKHDFNSKVFEWVRNFCFFFGKKVFCWKTNMSFSEIGKWWQVCCRIIIKWHYFKKSPFFINWVFLQKKSERKSNFEKLEKFLNKESSSRKKRFQSSKKNLLWKLEGKKVLVRASRLVDLFILQRKISKRKQLDKDSKSIIIFLIFKFWKQIEKR